MFNHRFKLLCLVMMAFLQNAMAFNYPAAEPVAGSTVNAGVKYHKSSWWNGVSQEMKFGNEAGLRTNTAAWKAAFTDYTMTVYNNTYGFVVTGIVGFDPMSIPTVYPGQSHQETITYYDSPMVIGGYGGGTLKVAFYVDGSLAQQDIYYNNGDPRNLYMPIGYLPRGNVDIYITDY